MEFDKWQQELIEHKGHVTTRAGRQVGKSTSAGKRRANQMQDYPGSISLITAPSQRQSSELFIKTMSWLNLEHRKAIDDAGGYKNDPDISERRNMELERLFNAKNGIFAEMPTKTTVKLKNDSICYALPAGKTGIYLRTFALDFLDIDEAAYVPDQVYTALKPMLAVSATTKGLGWESLYSTPFGKGGFFYDSHFDDDYKQFHINSEKCIRISREFLLKEKKRLTRIEYAQEYLGEFTEEFNQFFPTALIKERMTFYEWDYKKQYNRALKYFLGVDVARYGEDENAFIDAEMQTNKSLKIIKEEITERKGLVDTYKRIIMKDKMMDYNRIFIDDGGIGAGLVDVLIEKLGRKVVGLGNAKKTVDAEGQRTGRIFKEDLYSNAAMMMETGESEIVYAVRVALGDKSPRIMPRLEIINSLRLLRSLKSMTFSYTTEKNVRIFGKFSHLAEAFVRVCWAEKAKSLKLFCY